LTAITIARLAREGGVGVETVRFYQRRGLLEIPDRPGDAGGRGGVRRYDEADVQRLRFIRSAQAAGFTLEEIGELLALDTTRDRPRIRAMAAARISALETRIAELQTAKRALQDLAHACDAAGPGPCPIVVAFHVPARPG
jgi:MerR family transcriptional regulator, mercuric resistance operon regulatory protein